MPLTASLLLLWLQQVIEYYQTGFHKQVLVLVPVFYVVGKSGGDIFIYIAWLYFKGDSETKSEVGRP